MELDPQLHERTFFGAKCTIISMVLFLLMRNFEPIPHVVLSLPVAQSGLTLGDFFGFYFC